MRKMLCYLKAIPFYIKNGLWCPHVYKEIDRNSGIVIATKNSFRISENLLHNANETVYPKATIVRNRCIYCGHENLSWFDREPFVIKK